MKSIQNKLFLLSALLLLFYGCDDDNPVSTNVTEVQNLYSPEDGYSVTLDPNGTETFEWESAKAEDGGMVMYEVVFDEVGGDFSDPIYRITSDDNGVMNIASISHGTLNSVGAQAGLESEETGQLDWTVVSSRGVNELVSSQVNTIQITRLPGIANPPTNLYITGEGTEAGGDISNAMQLKSTGEGEFEIYTQLTTDGSYSFVNNTSDSPREFVIQDEESLAEGGEAPTIGENGVYRINLNFTTGSASLTKVENIEFYSGPHDEFLFELAYQGEGVFLAEEEPYSFYEWDWGLDSRYKFRMTVDAGGEQQYEWLGNDEADAGRPNDSSPDSYWYVYPVEGSQWDNSFKFQEDKHQSIIDVYMHLQPGIENYTHEVIKVGDQ